MATKIANFIIKNDLEGVDIDWEYPGAPDIPGIPPAEKDEGKNYLAFLAVLRNLLKGRSLSIAAPSSYCGTQNAFSQEGCEFGNCLRSQVNLTETQYSLAMITKAGVPSNKVIVGVTSFSRSFKMAGAGCYGPECLYTGERLNSDAKKGKCTDTAGYIANTEIGDILKDTSRVVKHFVDSTSNSDILIYDTEWVSYMSSSTKKVRENPYKSWGMGGTTDWAVDLQTYHDVPKPAAKTWALFKEVVQLGENPKLDDTRTGNWTHYSCSDPFIRNIRDYTKELDSKNRYSFSTSVAVTIKTESEPDRRKIKRSDCETKSQCVQAFESDITGPAAQLLWNSFVNLHDMFQTFDWALYKAATDISFSLDDFGNKFAPIPEEEDNTWLLVLIDLATFGTATAAGPLFNSFLKKLPYFAANGATHDNANDTTITIIGPGWTPEKQDSFSSYMGQTIQDWSKVNSATLYWMFNGTDEAIDMLWDIFSDGKLIGGRQGDGESSKEDVQSLTANIEKSFYGFTIPTLW
ncbi:hypothetical protein NCS56_00195800 [Fusarium sp. Ph1]|nr:hypothetical protein NCS56_00195800 [Fusarium sp. Ph1]